MPPPVVVGDDAEFKPANKLLPVPTTELESWRKSQRAGDDALPVFLEDAVHGEEWASEDPETKFDDPDGLMLLPGSWDKTEGIEWLRPSEMHLTEPPKFQKLLARNNVDADTDAQEPEMPPPVVAKQAKKHAKVQNLEFYVRSATNPLQVSDALTYHAVCAMNTAKSILASAHGQDIWDRIYPKNDQGQPRYNPGGKYIVKLNVMGKERMVTIDDRMPVLDGACLLPRTKDKAEIWPLLLTKALLKALSIPILRATDGEEDAAEDGPKRCFPDLSPRDVFAFFVTCLTGWQPETLPVRQHDALDALKRRMAKGTVFPCAWGDHPQERMKYISSISDSAPADAPPAEAPEHWDAQSDSAFLIKLDLDGAASATPRGGGAKEAVELQIPRMQWVLPQREAVAATPADKGEGEEGADGAAEDSNGNEAEGSQSGEMGTGRKMELMKPSIDVKYVTAWPTFVKKMTEFVFFHNAAGYDNSSTFDLSAAAVPPEEDAAATGEEEQPTEAGDDAGPAHKAKPKAGVPALYVSNPSTSDVDVLLCVSSACFQCPLTVHTLNRPAWDSPPEGTSAGVGQAAVAAYRLKAVETTDANKALLLRVGPGEHVLQVQMPVGVEAQVCSRVPCVC